MADKIWEVTKEGKTLVLAEVSQGKYRWIEKVKNSAPQEKISTGA